MTRWTLDEWERAELLVAAWLSCTVARVPEGAERELVTMIADELATQREQSAS